MFRTSEAADQIVPAIFEARKVFDPLVKRGENTYIKDGKGRNARYVKLEDVFASIEAAFETNGILITQAVGESSVTERTITVTDKNSKVEQEWPVFNLSMTTRIWHVSGQWIEFDSSLFYIGEKAISLAQVGGKVVTYLRRYAITAFFGLVTEEDTDAQPMIEKGSDTASTKAAPAKPGIPGAITVSSFNQDWLKLFDGNPPAARARLNELLGDRTWDEVKTDLAFLARTLSDEKIAVAKRREQGLATELAAMAGKTDE